ncbi:MAG: hypothetical protein II186_08865 [Erysipelotrichales bacterium]|nr:hypothetical protein [Erysipelotrichales bacterium]MBQ2310729.1 hypothetical protein [Erysipelotrichales bacterium]
MKSWNKTNILIVILAVCLFAGVCLWFLLFKNRSGKPGYEPKEGLVSVEYTCAGGMRGGHHTVELRYDKKGNPVLYRSEQETWNAKEKTSLKPAGKDLFEKAESLIVTYDLINASKRPDGENHVLDGDTVKISLRYADGSSYRIWEEQALSEKEAEGFWALADLLRNPE